MRLSLWIVCVMMPDVLSRLLQSTLDHSHVSFAVMADRKGKAVTPIKKLTKKEKEELKKNVSGSCSSDRGFLLCVCVL